MKLDPANRFVLTRYIITAVVFIPIFVWGCGWVLQNASSVWTAWTLIVSAIGSLVVAFLKIDPIIRKGARERFGETSDAE